jgi:hypothetical protein
VRSLPSSLRPSLHRRTAGGRWRFEHGDRGSRARDQSHRGKWRARFLQKGLEGLLDEPRPAAPRTNTDAGVQTVITKTLETAPRDATH